MPYSPLVSKIRVHNPNKKGSSNANRNYVTYIATREGVSLESIKNVNDLLNSEGMLEKEIREDVIHREADNKEYVEYMAKRPRSQGLFGNTDTSDLKKISSEIAELTKSGRIIYRGIISLSEKDGEELGFRNIDAWNNYLRRVMPDIAQSLGVSSYDHTWVAAFHAEETHPHVHYMLWDNRNRVKSPYIHKATQQKIRIHLENEMFDDAYERAIKQTLAAEHAEINKRRDMEKARIVKETANVIRQAGFVPGVEYEKLPTRTTNDYLKKIATETANLIGKIPEKGSLKYAYLPPEAKEQVNKIVDIVLEKPDVKNALDSYLEGVKRSQQLQGSTETKIKYEVNKEEADQRLRIANRIITEIKPIIQKSTESVLSDSIIEKEILKSESEKPELSSVSSDQKQMRKELRENSAEIFDYKIENGTEFRSVEDKEMFGEKCDIVKTIGYLEKSAEQGNQYAQYKLGVIYADKEISGEKYNIEKAIGYLEKSAEQGNQFAQYKLGGIYADKEISGEKYDIKKAIRYLEKSAEQGNQFAQYKLGKNYADKEAIPEKYNLDKAIKYLEKSAEQGNQFAQYKLGAIYADKEAIPERYDLDKAIKYLEKSAEQGNQFAQYKLGGIYASEELSGEKYDIEKAIGYLEKSAEQGNQFAQYKLGGIYASEELSGEKYDIEKAIRYLEKSADQGNQYAQCRLGCIFYFGKNVPKDEELGKYWLQKSAEQGDQFARDVLDGPVGINFSYCLLKGVLTSLETLNQQINYSNRELTRNQSRQAQREKYMHHDNQQRAEEENS